jgi:hypothetical protein
VTVGHNPPVPAFFFSFTPNTLFFFFLKNSGINPGQPAGKGRRKKKKKTAPFLWKKRKNRFYGQQKK